MITVFIVIENGFGHIFIENIFDNKESAIKEQMRLAALNSKDWISYRVEERGVLK